MSAIIPEPDSTLATPEYEISDHTAALKASRLMQELKDYASPENWHKTLKELGFNQGITNTRRWRRVLKLPQTRKDVIAACLDRNGQVMERPDPKRTAEVMVWLLSSATPEGESSNGSENDLYLSVIGFKRSEVLHPEKTDYMVGASRTMLKISFHALQRMIQRGYGLTKTGTISYRELLRCLTGVWCEACNHRTEKTTLPATFKVEYRGAIFIVKLNEEDNEMALVTMLPPKK